MKDDEDSADYHAKPDKIIPLERFPRIQHREDAKYDESNDFLDCFQLGRSARSDSPAPGNNTPGGDELTCQNREHSDGPLYIRDAQSSEGRGDV